MSDYAPALPADPLSRGPFMPTLPGEDDLRQRILALLVAKGGLAERTGALHPVYQNPVGGQPLSGGQVFLRSLVSGYNGQAEPDVKQAKALSALLSLDQTNAYRQGQLGLGAGRLADSQQRTALTAGQDDPTKIGSAAWARAKGLDPTQPGSAAWNHVYAEDIAQQNANTNKGRLGVAQGTLGVARGNLGERTRHNRVMEGQGSERIGLTASGVTGGTGGKGASPFTADNAYYRNLGEQMIAADKAKTGGQNEQSIRSWMNAQLRDLGTVEGNRRRARQGAAAPTGAPSTLDLLNRP